MSEVINLQQQKATVERKPVDRPATEADFENFKEGTFEVRKTAEEAVIGKSARVVEEVAVGRTVTNQSETVSDRVRLEPMWTWNECSRLGIRRLMLASQVANWRLGAHGKWMSRRAWATCPGRATTRGGLRMRAAPEPHLRDLPLGRRSR